MTTTTLRVIVDQIVAPVPGALGRYTLDLARAIVAAAPRGCDVEAVVSSSPPADYDRIVREIPGLSGLYKTTLARRELAAAWQLGLTTSPGSGMIHATSLFAPLRKHDRQADGNQVVVTVHDVLAWTHPDALSAASVAWQKAMLKRARRHADAVVVPTHALAERLGEVIELGDRIRVIGTAPRSGLVVGADAPLRAASLGLPPQYVVVPGTLEPRKGLVDVFAAFARPGVPDVPIVVIGPESWGDQHVVAVAEEYGLDPARALRFDELDPADLAVVIAGAMAFIAPSHDEGSGTPLIEAFSLATPVIHSDAPAFLEVSAGAGLAVPVGGGEGYADRLAAAITSVVTDPSLANRLSVAGGDRSRAFTWRDAGERVWQLHADL
ncbi:glycosyltransferase family 4 protein [Agromyces ramosus]|uniref:Glycosyltransferase involved in cell wall biosynthesis n=1 Tax=Agromyces ramosus TaxID=33879 RepID=A0ABU0RC84_9MICO|nr:glycosyltransferase family 1 protein [Agromyces ramosus]MDQ0895392.1 glycosyltransferase involved in cell wall biosynthesis [Agromyces ramosus]